MKSLLPLTVAILLYAVFALSSCALQEEAKAPAAPARTAEAKAAAPAKAKAIKARGDVGLLDTDKNYMILVTKEGKLLTVDFSDKTKVTKIVPQGSKIEDIGLGSSAAVEYRTEGEKKVITKIEYKPAKGGE